MQKTVKTWIALALLICTGSALAQAVQPIKFDVDFEQYEDTKLGEELGSIVSDLLNYFFAILGEGIPSLGVPPLDPLSILNLTIPTIPLPGGYMDAKIAFTQVAGISTCRSDSVTVNIEAGGGFIPIVYNGTMGMTFSLPNLHVSGDYWLDGLTLGVLPLYGEGPYTIDISDASFGGGGGITVNVKTGQLQLQWLDLQLSFSQMVTDFQGLLGGGDFGSEINEMLSTLGTGIINAVMPTLTSKLSTGIVSFLNDALAGVNIWDIIPKPS